MDERITELRAELREDPTSRLFYQLGELLRREEAHEEAVRVLRGGLEHHPRYVAAWVALGRSLATLERHDEAEKAGAKALELDPENAVAARMIGESAAARGDLVRAVKGLKLARVLSPRDQDLEDRIAEVEAGLADQGLLEAPVRRRGDSGPLPRTGADLGPQPGGLTTIPSRRLVLPQLEIAQVEEGDPFLLGRAGDTGVWLLGDDVFEAPEPEVEPELEGALDTLPGEEAEPEIEALQPWDEPVGPEVAESPDWELGEASVAAEPTEPQPVAEPTSPDWEVEDLDGAGLPPPDDAGGWEVATPVSWATVAGEGVPSQEPVVGSLEPVDEMESEPADSGELPGEPEPLEAEPAGTVEDVEPEHEWQTLEAEPVDELATEHEPEIDEDEWPDVEEIPLPTLTLARLAYEQGDLRLAERTLEGVIERQPQSAEALALLERVRREREPVPVVAPLPDEADTVETSAPAGPAIAKIAALRGWADAIRLAAEQRQP